MATDPNNPFAALIPTAPVAAPAPSRAPSAAPVLVQPRQIRPEDTVAYRAAVAGAETAAREQAKAVAAAAPTKTPEQKKAIDFKFGETIGTIRSAISQVSPLSSGFGAFTQDIPYAPAQGLASDIATIKANLGFDKLQEMRDLSPTGGALGQVAVEELRNLQQSVANLDNRLPPDKLKANLRKVEFHYANMQRILNGAEPFASRTDYYKELDRKKKEEMAAVAAEPVSKQEIATGEVKTISDPARKGLNSKIRARIAAGQTSDEIVSFLNMASPGLGDSLAGQVDAAVKYRQQFPDTPISRYPIDVERVQVPASAAEQRLGRIAKSYAGGYISGAAQGLTGGTLAQLTDNPELTKAALRGISEESPVLSFLGEASGAALSMLPAVRGLRAAGLGARAAGLGAGTAYGGVYGGATGEGDLATDVVTGATTGLVGGIVGEAAAKGLGRVLAPQIDKAVSVLAEKKIPMTLGQMLGGGFKTFEDKLQSVPFAGDVIRRGRERGIEQTQRVVIDEALAPLGKSLPKDIEVGTDAMKYMQMAFDDAYDAVRSRMAVRRDNKLARDLTDIVSSAKSGGELTDAQADQLRKIVQSQVLRRFAKNTGQMDGDLYKRASSDLKKLARENYGTPLGSRINDVRVALDDAATRFSPKDAVDELKAIDTGYAKSVIIETAAKMRAGAAGEFSPTQLRTAVQNVDRSLRNKQFLRGEAQLQDIAEAARKVLPGVTPDSGTAGREAIVTGNVGALSKIASPVFAAGATQPGSAFMKWLLMNRPDLARKLGAGLQSPRSTRAAQTLGTVYGTRDRTEY